MADASELADYAIDAGPAISDLKLGLQVRRPAVEKFAPDPRLLARNLVIGPGASGEAARAYKILRAEATKRLRQNSWKTVAITSSSPGSGTTLTAINLAISFAQDFGRTVLLVELNLINPSFHRKLGFQPRKGVADYLVHHTSLSEIALDIGIERLVVVPAGSPVANSSELLASPRMAQFVEEISRCYENLIVLFDLPPVLTVDDAVAFAPLVDCAMLVIEEDETRIEDVRKALRRLEPTKILGMTLNRSIR